MNRWTQLVNFNPCPEDNAHASSTPIYQTATFIQGSSVDQAQYNYSRSANPTRNVLEKQLATLEAGQYAFAYNSGIAALCAIIGLLQPEDHMIVGDDLYGGTHRLLTHWQNLHRIQVTYVDTTQLVAVQQAITAQTKFVLIETPTNPYQKITDIAALADFLKTKNIYLVVDNTCLSPWLQKPLLLGADVVVHSATKHLGGHGDLTAGAIIINNPDIAEKLAFAQNAEGSALAPFDCWLLLRGIKTLGLRIERQQQNALKIAEFLTTHPAVKKIYYSGLPSHPGYRIQKQQAHGAGSLMSFETSSVLISQSLLKKVRLFAVSVSFGNLKSLISLPWEMSHASISEEKRRIPPDLVRISIGIEDAEDLIADLKEAF